MSEASLCVQDVVTRKMSPKWEGASSRLVYSGMAVWHEAEWRHMVHRNTKHQISCRANSISSFCDASAPLLMNCVQRDCYFLTVGLQLACGTPPLCAGTSCAESDALKGLNGLYDGILKAARCCTLADREWTTSLILIDALGARC